jgi:hypothetical protein
VAGVQLGGVDEAVPHQVAKIQATWKEQVPQHTLQPAWQAGDRPAQKTCEKGTQANRAGCSLRSALMAHSPFLTPDSLCAVLCTYVAGVLVRWDARVDP